MNKFDFYKIDSTKAATILGAVWKCPKCSDWFHMPYKYCKCNQGKLK